MAQITLGTAIAPYQWWPNFFEPGDTTLITTATATRFKWTNTDGSTVELKGAGLAYDLGDPVAGTITAMTVRDSGGQTLITFAGLAADFVSIFYDAFGYNRSNGNHQNPDGFNLLTGLMQGNDTITGSNNSDDIVGGRNPGNDVIDGRGGDDFIKGDAGNDTIDGGTGGNTLSYLESFYDPSAFQGITVNMAAGTVLDCWGGTDQIVNFDRIEGSKFADTFNGDTGDDQFLGLRGADSFFGGGGNGFDEIAYYSDANRGGLRGIIVNFGTGKIKDGWGQTDTVVGINSVVGTEFADTYIGGALDDQFLGGGGVDMYDGKGGNDKVNFSWGPALNGSRVNMTLATGQVLDDGLGNVETLINIEGLDGNELDDFFTANDASNRLDGDRGNDTMLGRGGNDRMAGDGGADTMTGGAGADEFHYSRREGNDPWGDTITDFKSGTDFLSFQTGDFSGMDTTLRFANAGAAGGVGSWFYFKNSTDELFWDADGTGGGAAVVVAILTGVSALSAADFQLF